MNREQQQRVWTGAYNAALTGLLGGGIPIGKEELRKGCNLLAEQALEDFAARWPSSKERLSVGGAPEVFGSE